MDCGWQNPEQVVSNHSVRLKFPASKAGLYGAHIPYSILRHYSFTQGLLKAAQTGKRLEIVCFSDITSQAERLSHAQSKRLGFTTESGTSSLHTTRKRTPSGCIAFNYRRVALAIWEYLGLRELLREISTAALTMARRFGWVCTG